MRLPTLLFGILLLILITVMTGCSTTTPVARKFPDVPASQLEGCPKLVPLQENAKLSDVALTVANNYASHYDCVVKNDAWIEWYQKQKSIFDSVK